MFTLSLSAVIVWPKDIQFVHFIKCIENHPVLLPVTKQFSRASLVRHWHQARKDVWWHNVRYFSAFCSDVFTLLSIEQVILQGLSHKSATNILTGEILGAFPLITTVESKKKILDVTIVKPVLHCCISFLSKD